MIITDYKEKNEILDSRLPNRYSHQAMHVMASERGMQIKDTTRVESLALNSN
jgi:hypothetical protein